MSLGFSHESQKSKSIDWYTPKHVFDSLNVEFDLDPCCPQGGVPWIPAKSHYSLPFDGLSMPWNGFVWCNPPYGKETVKWLTKMGNHNNGVALVFARTDTKWFHDVVAKADAILFLSGRIQFVDAYQKTGGSGSSCGSMLVAWGDKGVAALKGMKDEGFLVLNKGEQV
jgi:hypothetical protein